VLPTFYLPSVYWDLFVLGIVVVQLNDSRARQCLLPYLDTDLGWKLYESWERLDLRKDVKYLF
jgi:hypothetical protein